MRKLYAMSTVLAVGFLISTAAVSQDSLPVPLPPVHLPPLPVPPVPLPPLPSPRPAPVPMLAAGIPALLALGGGAIGTIIVRRRRQRAS
jgi:hypothetical protein